MSHPPLFRFPTHPAHDLCAIAGATAGDPIAGERDTVPGDLYRLTRGAPPRTLAMADTPRGPCVADGSEVGTPGEPLSITTSHTLMAPNGDVVELLMLMRDTPNGPQSHVLPLSPLRPDTEYELVGTDTAAAPERFADIASVSFLAGTHLTLAGGRQVPVEDLVPGDLLLTRDHGAQPIRWIGMQTRRATGAAAPVRLTAGTLNTSRDLRLSPHHRLFIWQRLDELGTGRAEVMVKAELLVNGTTVLRDPGGYVDTYQIVFDGHEIIFAEGIAVESLLVTGQTQRLLPADLRLPQGTRAADKSAGIELGADAAARADNIADRLSRASRGESPSGA